MVLQPKLRDLPDAEAAALKKTIKGFENFINVAQTGGSKNRRGIFTGKNASGDELSLFDHQVMACLHIFATNKSKAFEDRRVRKVLLHEMGTGKTITGLAFLAFLYKSVCTRVADFKNLIVCPKSLVSVWKDAIDWCLDISEVGTLLVATHQSQLTNAAMDKACIIVTTADVLVSARKTYMYRKPDAYRSVSANGVVTIKPGYVRGLDPVIAARKGKQEDLLPPIHPVFDSRMFAAVIIDETTAIGKSTTWKAHVVSALCRRSTYVVALTGTPFKNCPDEAASLCQTIDVIEVWLQEPRSWYKDKKAGTVNPHTVSYFHAKLVDRVPADALLVDVEQRTCDVYIDPFVGLCDDPSVCTQVTQRHELAVEDTRKACKVLQRRGPAFRAGSHLAQLGVLMRSITYLEQAAFSPILAIHGAAAFDRIPGCDADTENARIEQLYRDAILNPSQQMEYMLRLVQDRFANGKQRIILYTPDLKMQLILCRYFQHMNLGAAHFHFNGSITLAWKRNATIKAFLASKHNSLLFLTAAGSMGLTVCPGCETMILYGAWNWSPTDDEQVKARIFRIGQTKPVEFIRVITRRGISESKLHVSADKSNLCRALVDEDYSGLARTLDTDVVGTRWKTQLGIAANICSLNSHGNYGLTERLKQIKCSYNTDVEAARYRGVSPDDMNTVVPMHPSLVAYEQEPLEGRLAKDTPIPRCSFPDPNNEVAPVAAGDVVYQCISAKEQARAKAKARATPHLPSHSLVELRLAVAADVSSVPAVDVARPRSRPSSTASLTSGSAAVLRFLVPSDSS